MWLFTASSCQHRWTERRRILEDLHIPSTSIFGLHSLMCIPRKDAHLVRSPVMGAGEGFLPSSTSFRASIDNQYVQKDIRHVRLPGHKPSDLKALCLVNKDFYEIVVPGLYREIILSCAVDQWYTANITVSIAISNPADQTWSISSHLSHTP